MNDITPKEAIEILSHYTDLGYGVVIEGEDTSKIKQALSFASKTLANGTPYNPSGDCISREALKEKITRRMRYAPISENAKQIIITAILSDIDEEQAVKQSLLPLSGEADNAYMRGYEVGKAEGILKAETRPSEQIAWEQGYEVGLAQGKQERPQGEWVRKEDVIHHIAKQYSEHNELVPIWLSIGDMKGGAE